MPTLFRLLITLLFLAGLVFAGMFALVAFVEPQPRPVSQKIPARELLGEAAADARGPSIPLPKVDASPGAAGPNP